MRQCAPRNFDGSPVHGFRHGSLPIINTELRDPTICWDGQARTRGAAVAVLFIPCGEISSDCSRVVLTVRSTQVGSHKGQIAFAGGRMDDEDFSPHDTVLRELQEEIGIPAEQVQVFGALPAINALDGSVIIPILMAAAITEDAFRLCDDEVAGLILIPWRNMTAAHNRRFRFNMFGNWRESDRFDYQKHVIWGLTAKIIADLDMQAASRL